jgi:hypothetical protein
MGLTLQSLCSVGSFSLIVSLRMQPYLNIFRMIMFSKLWHVKASEICPHTELFPMKFRSLIYSCGEICITLAEIQYDTGNRSPHILLPGHTPHHSTTYGFFSKVLVHFPGLFPSNLRHFLPFPFSFSVYFAPFPASSWI